MRCIHTLTQDICEDKGIPYTYEQEYSTIDEALKYNRSYNVFVQDGDNIHSYIRREYAKGGISVIRAFEYRQKVAEWPLDFKFDRIFAKKERTLSEVSDIQPSGKYKDSLGGGWSSEVDMYVYKGEEYADMECTCK